ncbi:MAG: AraC family transcriptional regulator [Lachnospiraceae bacterium]|nr:AraC family transcriptional regulator [Lachnospiraceae bacterium]MDY5742105.1 AraC family transcriptional regulator [Lachnospiraceae bacterium]
MFLVHTGKEHCKEKHTYTGSRTEYIIHFVLSGKGSYSVNGRTWELSAGQMFIIYPGQVVIYRADEADPWVYAWIGFDGIKTEAIISRCGFSRTVLVRDYASPEELERKRQMILGHINAMLDAKQLTFANDLKRRASLMLLFADLIDDHDRRVEEDRVARYDYSANVYVEHAIDFIKCHYQESINVGEVAEHIGISRNYLNQVFQKELGVSIQKFLIDFRLHKAASLLLDTSNSVGDIGKWVGYGDQLAFSKAFKKKFGVSPKFFRTRQETVLEYDHKL